MKKVNQRKMVKKSNCLGSTPKKLLKSNPLQTQDLPIDHVKTQCDLISTTAVNQGSRMEHKAIIQAHDQNITTIEESQTHPSTATHTSDLELTYKAYLEQLTTQCREIEVATHKNERMIEELIEGQNANISLLLEIKVSSYNLRRSELMMEEFNKRTKVQCRNLRLMLRRAQEFKMGHFHMNHK